VAASLTPTVHDEVAKKRMRQEEGMEEEEEEVVEPQAEFDPELPGGGRFYCMETARHFISQDALSKHINSKQFKKRAKELSRETKYDQTSSESALGISKEVLPVL
jgi:bud site selection protein 20